MNMRVNEYFDISSETNAESTFFDVLSGKEESELSSKHQHAHHSHHKYNLVESGSIYIIAHVVNTSMEIIVEMS